MRIAKTRYGTPHPGRPVATIVVGGATAIRRSTIALLRDSGFKIDEQATPSHPELLLLLLSDATDAARVGDVRDATLTHPDARVLAIMPAKSPSASLKRVLLAGATGIALDDDLERTLVPTAYATLAGQLTVPTAL